MPTPNYSSFISGVVTRLKESNDLNSIADEQIYYGPNVPQIVEWPAVTVELNEVQEEWRTFGGTKHGQKDALCSIVIGVYDKAFDYMSGLNSVEDKVRQVENVLRSDTGVSGNFYFSETTTKRFAEVEFNNTPVFSAEIVLNGKIRFTQAG